MHSAAYKLLAMALLAATSIAGSARASGSAPEVWLAPDNDTPDLTAMFDHPEQWSRLRGRINVMQFGPQQVMGENPNGINKSDDLARVNAFKLLGQWGIGIAIEAPSVKPWDCVGDVAAKKSLSYVEVVRRAGGTVKALALDEPMAAALKACSQSLQQVALNTSNYIKNVKSRAAGILIGDIEAYPLSPVGDLIDFVRALEQNGARPDFFHLDVNIPAANRRKDVHLSSDLRTLQDFLHKEGIPFGVIIWSGYNPEPSDRAFYERAMDWSKQVHGAVGTPDQLIFESWAWRSSQSCQEGGQDCTRENLRCTSSDPSFCGKKSVPVNLPDNDPSVYSLSRLVMDSLKLFGN